MTPVIWAGLDQLKAQGCGGGVGLTRQMMSRGGASWISAALRRARISRKRCWSRTFKLQAIFSKALSRTASFPWKPNPAEEPKALASMPPKISQSTQRTRRWPRVKSKAWTPLAPLMPLTQRSQCLSIAVRAWYQVNWTRKIWRPSKSKMLNSWIAFSEYIVEITNTRVSASC